MNNLKTAKMNNTEISRIIIMLQNTYNGAAWHGPSVMEVLNKINVEQAFHSSEHIHRICELVQHITAWRTFAIKRLQGEQHYEVSQSENWKFYKNKDTAAWEEIKSNLSKSQETLLNVLINLTDEMLNDEVDGKAYSYYTLIHGVIQHDLYHLGEIALLAREYS